LQLALVLAGALIYGPDVTAVPALVADVTAATRTRSRSKYAKSPKQPVARDNNTMLLNNISQNHNVRTEVETTSGGGGSRNGNEYGNEKERDTMNSNARGKRDDDVAIVAQRAKAGFRYVEDIAPGLKLDMDLYSILHTSTSSVQSIQVIDSYFGRTLVTDGKTQSAEHDEFVYHESLVHPALFWSAHLSKSNGGRGDDGAPRSVFIGGGGELATAREVLRHDTIERVVMVDIDPMVIEVSREYLPEWGGDAVLDHPKVEYVVGDVREYLRTHPHEKFDVAIVDVSDPIEAGPAVALYTQEFYQLVSQRLNPNGAFVTQAGSASFVPLGHAADETCFGPIRNTLATVFDHAIPYSAPVASFGEDWGFVLAFNGPLGRGREVADLEIGVVDDMIEERIGMVPGVPEHNGSGARGSSPGRAMTGYERGGDVLRHYDGVVHRRLFSLSKPLRKAMQGDERVMTEANPIFMY